MSDIALLYTSFPDRAQAEHAAEAVVAERLAACVHVLAPCTAVYRWRGAVEHADEVPVLFKTMPNLVARLRDRIAALHSYDLPVIEAWPVAVTDAAFAWVDAETGVSGPC
ncbi:MAG: divalent-cation tolerance protein CutA [Pseudomonadota bacterium]